MSRAFISRLQAARQAVTGHKLGTVKTLWQARPGQAAGPDPSSAQAALEAWFLHVSYGFGFMSHPLGYVGIRDQRDVTNSWLTPHADQLVMEATAPANWIEPFVDSTRRPDVVNAGGSQLVVGFDRDTSTSWLIGPEGTAIVLVPYGRIELEKRPLPTELAHFVDRHPPVLHVHPTDRLLSALVRRFLLTDYYLSPHSFFSFDGHLGLEFGRGAPRDPIPDHDLVEGFDFATVGELMEACLTDQFLGMSDVRVALRTRDWVAIEDSRNGARLLLGWRHP